MNAFVVTVALGSTLATAILSKDVTLADGALAFGTLIALQFAVTWTSVRVKWVRRLATGEPMMLLHRGEFLHAGLRSARVTEDEVRAAVRASGVVDLGGVEAVVLETDGSFSVLPTAAPGGGAASSLWGSTGSSREAECPADRRARRRRGRP
jgi:uncharacterized membrane protein YcaP (DUF421 family)